MRDGTVTRALHRPYARRRRAPRAGRSPSARPLVRLSDAERHDRIQRVARYLVRTVRGCPAPGVAPLSRRDWLLILAVAGVPYLIVFGAVALVGRL